MHDFAGAHARGSLQTVELDVGYLLRLSLFPATEPYWGKTAPTASTIPLKSSARRVLAPTGSAARQVRCAIESL